jgi:UDP-N-acetylglucosamine 2-epimerase
MKKIVSIVGARPNFIKLDPNLPQIIIHTGQHYDVDMSDVFFKDLKLQKPKYHLGLNKSQVGPMISGLQKIFQKEKPKMVMVYGDTNSTAAGAIAAYQERIPVGHVEAGMRSFNRQMLEEYNRIITDHIASLNFCPTKTAINNLKKEGISDCHFVGDVMYDRLLLTKSRFRNFKQKDYIFMTLHRAETVDNKEILKKIFKNLAKVEKKIIFPIHPRTQKSVKKFTIKIGKNMKVSKPLSYSKTVKAILESKAVITDSGGLQKEAYFLKKPCFILRHETEWPEIVDGKSIFLISPKNLDKFSKLLEEKLPRPTVKQELFGNGEAWKNIRNILKQKSYL